MKENEFCSSCKALQFCQFQVNYHAASEHGEQIVSEKTRLFEKSEAQQAVKQRLKGIE